MAAPCSVLSEDQFLCSICLDVFKDPVSTPCGHNFCKYCITRYWDVNDLYQCPFCKEIFDHRPDLRVNITLKEVVEKFNMNARGKDRKPATPGEVSCDICQRTKLKAMKSCLVCLTSYCETHLEPHQRVAGLKKHKLIDPVESLEDRMCKTHGKLLEMFCRSDQTCVCLMCISTDHQTHNAVPVEEEGRERKTKVGEMISEINQMIQIRCSKVGEIRHSVETSRRDAQKEISDSMEVFNALVRAIERSRAELIEMIEEKQKAEGKRAEMFMKDLEQEISELKKRSTELEQLSHTEDHLHLLQSFPSLSTPPHTKDWSGVSVHSGPHKGTVRKTVSKLKERLNKEMDKVSENKLRRIQQYAVNVTLDPNTAHPKLVLSESGRRVSHGDVWKILPNNPERFSQSLIVLGKRGFSSGRFYYEVGVERKTKWDIGVARDSVDRKSMVILNPVNGYWTLSLRNGNEYTANTGPGVVLSMSQHAQKVGVFVDYEGGLVSFYDVELMSLIYSYTGCSFKENVHPFFNPCLNDGSKNSAPLIISQIKY